MKKTILAILIMSLFIITACTTEKTAPTTGGAFIGGTAGITAAFEPLSIEQDGVFTIFDTEEFSLDVLLKNKGEETVKPDKVTLRLLGPAQTDFQNIQSWELKNSQEIEKVSEFNPEGGEEIVSFSPEANAKYTGLVTGLVDITWNLEYVYEYKTHLIVDEVCFKGDLTDKKVCKVKEPKTFSVSGAPITITSVEEDSAGRGVVLLKIQVQDSGIGDSTVAGKDFDHRFDQVAYTVDEPEKWECKSGGRENEARLTEGKATIICRLKTPLSEDDLYVRNVRITFDYLYKELIQEKLRIKESAK
jgi:hypothetical protein